jgi:hypothetical protein
MLFISPAWYTETQRNRKKERDVPQIVCVHAQSVQPTLPVNGGCTAEFLLGGADPIMVSLGFAFVWRRKCVPKM